MMEWISNNTKEGSVFTGSMQLMSAIRLSTGRSITNHPHYENGDLRLKTRILYQAIYGRSKIKDSHDVLKKKYNINYIVIEPSICFAVSDSHQFSAFRYVDMLDQHMGVQPEAGQFAGDPRLKPPADPENPNRLPTFCEKVYPPPGQDRLSAVVEGGLTTDPAKNQLFRRVFKNKTFVIFEIL